MNPVSYILVIQTAFTGDAILGTALLEALHARFPEARLSYLVRKGNEGLFADHPYLHEVLVFDKTRNKLKNLFRLARRIRRNRYNLVINLQRFASSGFLAVASGAKDIRGFDKNPWAFLFDKKIPHSLGDGRHEIERNADLIRDLVPFSKPPRLYPTRAIFDHVKRDRPYICLAPASVWQTKQWPASHWSRLITLLSGEVDIALTGGKGDAALCERIIQESDGKAENLAGRYNLLESAALIAGAEVTVSNDSAPVHLASALNAPVIEIYCSTVPQFGFFPLSDRMHIVETEEKLDCRPCGLHGKKACPLGHFKCGTEISPERVARIVRSFYTLAG